MGTKHIEEVSSCPKWPRQHFHTIFNDSAPNSPDVEECDLKTLCNCCGKRPLTGKEYWNVEGKYAHNPESFLCEPCHWDPAIRFDQCQHSGTYEKYMEAFRR